VGAITTRIDIRIGHFSKESVAGAIISLEVIQSAWTGSVSKSG
jgi:hypothetical protein